MKPIFRVLTIKDLNDYRRIRLELLRNHPTGFGSSYEEESEFNDEMWINRLSKEHIYPYGAFIDDELVGVCLIVMNPRKKMRHVATLNSMYVNPKFRKKRIAQNLLEVCLRNLQDLNVEIVNLSVVSSNVPAIELYTKIGFFTYGLEQKTIKYQDEYYDLLLMSKVITEG